MKLNNIALHELFTEKEILYLYHANTVATSITFIEQEGLLSRGAVEAKKLYQSPQSSDAIDKVFNVWDDIFLDTTDIHGYFPRQNYYGPISFQFSIDFLLSEDYDIWITKDNPINWKREMTDSEKYFVDVEELRTKWNLYPRQQKMVTIRGQKEPLLFNFIKKIVIDDPKVKIEEKSLFNQSIEGIKSVVIYDVPLKNKFAIRECSSNCYCQSNYLHQVSVPDLKRLFLPKEKI